MRTTLDIDDQLYRTAKVRAAEEGKTLTSIVEEALRLYLKPEAPEKPFRLRWVTRRGRIQQGVNIDDRHSLYEIMEGRQ